MCGLGDNKTMKVEGWSGGGRLRRGVGHGGPSTINAIYGTFGPQSRIRSVMRIDFPATESDARGVIEVCTGARITTAVSDRICEGLNQSPLVSLLNRFGRDVDRS